MITNTSDYDNATLISAIFDPSFPDGALYAPWVHVDETTPETGGASDKPTHAMCRAPLQAAVSESPAQSDPPSWDDIKRKQWSDIEARYKAGGRDKETVCAWMAYKAALKICKGWPQSSFDELLSEGYQAAVRRWPDYDPTKATKNGIAGFIYKAAEGRMRNAAYELFTKHGKRKHAKDDVLPVVSGLVSGLASHEAPEIRSPVTTSKVDAYSADDSFSDDMPPADSFTNIADVGGTNDKAVTAAAKKAERAKFNYNWTTQVQDAPQAGDGETPTTVKQPRGKADPTSIDRNASRVTRDSAEIRVQDLIAMLPSTEGQKLVRQHWGVDGHTNPMTVEELAKAGDVSEATVRKRLEKLLIELRLLSPRTPRQSEWRKRAEGIH